MAKLLNTIQDKVRATQLRVGRALSVFILQMRSSEGRTARRSNNEILAETRQKLIFIKLKTLKRKTTPRACRKTTASSWRLDKCNETSNKIYILIEFAETGLRRATKKQSIESGLSFDITRCTRRGLGGVQRDRTCSLTVTFDSSDTG